MEPYRNHYQGKASLNKVNRTAITERFSSFIPDRDYSYFNGKINYDNFARTLSSSYDKFVSGLQKLLEKPRTKDLALNIAEKNAHLLALNQFAQVAAMVNGQLDLEAMLSSNYYSQDDKRIKNDIVSYLRQKVPRNVSAHIEFYEGGKRYNHYRLDQDFNISVSDIPNMKNGKIILTVIDDNTRYKVEFTFRRSPFTDSDKSEGKKPEDMPFNIYAKPRIIQKNL